MHLLKVFVIKCQEELRIGYQLTNSFNGLDKFPHVIRPFIIAFVMFHLCYSVVNVS